METEQLDIADFLTIETKNRNIFEEKLSILKRQSCECCFHNLFFWSEVYDERFSELKNRLIVASFTEKEVMFPIGEYFEPSQLANLSNTFRWKFHWPGSFYDVPEEYINQYHSTISAYFKIETSENYYDYIYRTESLAKLSGAKLNKKRNLTHQFKKKFPDIVIEKISAENIPLVLEFLNMPDRNSNSSNTLDDEHRAIERALRHWEQLSTEGLLIVDGSNQAIAFSVFSQINNNTYDIHFEKASRSFIGASQVINQETAKLLMQRGVSFINREQDLGLPGLRQAKRSYVPEYMLKRYRLTALD